MVNARVALRGTIASVMMAMPSLVSGPAAAQEYCVACTGPDAVYRCVIEQAVPTGMPLKMLCISTLAKDGAHGSCAIRKGTVFDCNGPIRKVDARTAGGAIKDQRPSAAVPQAPQAAVMQAAPPAPQPSAATGQAPHAPNAAPPRPDAKPSDAPPETVEKLAKQVSRSSADALGQAGDAIAGSTRKAWGCVTSFFKSC